MKWIVGATAIAVIFGMAATLTIPAQTITPDQNILRLFPPETLGVAFIDAAGLRNSSFIKDISGEAGFPKLPPRVQEYATATGFQAERDLKHVTIGSLGPRQSLIIAEANYDKFKIEQYLNDRGVPSEAYRGRAVYRNDEQGGIAFIDNLILAGNYDAVKKAIDQMSLPGSSSLRSELLDAIRSIDEGSQVWAVGQFSVEELSQMPFGGRLPVQSLELFKTLKSGTYQMRVDQDVHARAIGNFSDADTAKAISDMARGVIALAKLQVAQQEDLLHLLDGIRVSNSAASITVNVDAPGELLKKLKDMRLRPRTGN